MLKKDPQSIVFHIVHLSAERDEYRMSYVNTHDNESQFLTKGLPNRENRMGFMKHFPSYLWLLGRRELGESDKIWLIKN